MDSKNGVTIQAVEYVERLKPERVKQNYESALKCQRWDGIDKAEVMAAYKKRLKEGK
jgi:hypothetical protein